MKAAWVAIDKERHRTVSLGYGARRLKPGQQQSVTRRYKKRHQQLRNIEEGVRETLARKLQINLPLRKQGNSSYRQQGAKKTRLGQ
jgi:hypothetical protein